MPRTPAAKPAKPKPPARVGQEFYRGIELNHEDDASVFDKVELETWVVVTVGTKYVTLYQRTPWTWIRRKGEHRWADTIASWDIKRIPLKTFPAGAFGLPEVFRTQQQAMADRIARLKRDLQRNKADAGDSVEFDTKALAAWEQRLKGLKTKRTNARRAKAEAAAG